jgi:hypothetical protein
LIFFKYAPFLLDADVTVKRWMNLLVHDLKEPMKLRGDTGQVQRVEEKMRHLDELEGKLDLIMEHWNIPKPM